MDGRTMSNCVLLLVVGEPFTEDEKSLILEQITKGFCCWNVEATGININEELAQIANKSSFEEIQVHGDQLLQHQSQNLSLEIVINPQTQTLKNSIKKLLISPALTKYIIYAGHVYQGSGAWVLQDDTFTFTNLAQVARNVDVENALKQNNAANLTIHTLSNSQWGPFFNKADVHSNLKIQVNPEEKLEHAKGINQFVSFLGRFLKVTPITSLLQASQQFGNISFTRPTLYIFPGCQGDSALFGVSGFNLLVNVGYNRQACFWDFARHLDRIDAMLVTHLGQDNIFGLKSVLQRKSLENIHPHIGYLYFNSPEKQILLPPEEEAGSDSSNGLLINLTEEASKVASMAKQLGITPHPCSRSATSVDCDPINLYHKLGQGSLDMYILNPVADSKELKEFYQLWNKQSPNLGTSGPFSLQNIVSVCALLVWRPYNFDEKIVRIMFPGNSPQHKIIEGFEKMKSFVFLKSAYCTSRELMKPSVIKKTSTVGSSKPALASKGPIKTKKSETQNNGNTAKVESPRKEIRNFSSKPEAKVLLPAESAKSVKKESSHRNIKVSDKLTNEEKDTKLKQQSVNESDNMTSPKPVPVSSPVKGSKSSNTDSSVPGKATLSTQVESSSVKKYVPTSDNKEDTGSLVAAAPASEPVNDASPVNHEDSLDVQELSKQKIIEANELNSYQSVSNISEARDAVGAIDDGILILSEVDREKIESLDFCDDKYRSFCADRRVKFDTEDERPQALPEPSVVEKSPSLESEDLSASSCSNQANVKEQSELDISNASRSAVYDLAQNTSQSLNSPVESLNKQPECQAATSLDQRSEFETPVFSNEEPNLASCLQQPSMEQSIQYGIDNSSHGRDMGGIQEVDEEENEDYTTSATNMDDNLDEQKQTQYKEDIDNDMEDDGADNINGFENDSNPDDSKARQLLEEEEYEEEEEIGSDSRTSAERQFEDVEDQLGQEDIDRKIKDHDHYFANDVSPHVDLDTATKEDASWADQGLSERDDKDSLDGCSPNFTQSPEESIINGNVDFDVGETNKAYTAEEETPLNLPLDEDSSVAGENRHHQNHAGAIDESKEMFDPVTQWDKPMGLPSPSPMDRKPPMEGKKVVSKPMGAAKTSKADIKADEKKQAGSISKTGAPRPGSVAKKVSSSSRSSPSTTKISTLPPFTPFYVDLTYVPNHADSSYSDVEFFKRIRARYYVISALSLNVQMLDALLEAKATWEQKDLEVTIIPTYDNETLRHWMGLNSEKLHELRVDLKPAVSRCTIQLQDLETSLPAYRLEV